MQAETLPKNILVAPLNWGLGHATRCIPIIKALQQHNFIPIIASDGIALTLLKKEFPYLQALELPSYGIEYPKKGRNFKWKFLKNSPKIIEAVFEEKKMVKKWIKEFALEGIISDNRFGVFSKKVPSVFITHQLNVLSGTTSWITSYLHQNIIKKFTECWVPDTATAPNLSGKLGHLTTPSPIKIKYIGSLSRMQKNDSPVYFPVMVVLSGPEPQRELLEKKLTIELLQYPGKVLFVKGIVEEEQLKTQISNITFYNYMNSKQLDQAFNTSEIILCRSGYTTIMDLHKLGKKAFFIPTPGQYEQLYLAKKLKKEGIAPFVYQNEFTLENLQQIALYRGFQEQKNKTNWEEVLEVFSKTTKTNHVVPHQYG